jgi:hypothetical protein
LENLADLGVAGHDVEVLALRERGCRGERSFGWLGSLPAAASSRWRAGIEEQWESKHAARMVGENAFAVTDSSGLKVDDGPNNPAIGDT